MVDFAVRILKDLDPEGRVHLCGHGVRAASGPLQKGDVRSSAAGKRRVRGAVEILSVTVEITVLPSRPSLKTVFGSSTICCVTVGISPGAVRNWDVCERSLSVNGGGATVVSGGGAVPIKRAQCLQVGSGADH